MTAHRSTNRAYVPDRYLRKVIVLSFIGLTAGVLLGADSQVLFLENFEVGLNSAWKKVEFHGETEARVQREGTNSFLRATAQSSASGLAVKLDVAPAQKTVLSWRWRIDRVPPGGSDDNIKTFDHTARVFVAFKTFLGPPRTINYVWANQIPVGGTFSHPNSGRARFIVLESGNPKAGQWRAERRDLARDWRTLFGDEKPPTIVGLGFMTDSDGTRSTVTGDYDDIELRRDK
jgi:hypothetical protein